jgi:hypothetical protein
VTRRVRARIRVAVAMGMVAVVAACAWTANERSYLQARPSYDLGYRVAVHADVDTPTAEIVARCRNAFRRDAAAQPGLDEREVLTGCNDELAGKGPVYGWAGLGVMQLGAMPGANAG